LVSVLEQRVVDAVGPSAFNIYENHLTKPQMAKAIGRNPRTLDNWHRARKGPPRIAFAGIVLYNIDSFKKWLAALEQAPGAKVKPQHPSVQAKRKLLSGKRIGGRPKGSKNRPKPPQIGTPAAEYKKN
jgi:hypothetical protein